MIRDALGYIDKLYFSVKNIDFVAIKNPMSSLMAYFGNEKEIINLAIKYLNENNLDACLSTLSKINIELLHQKNHLLAEYWSLCFDIYNYKSTYHTYFKEFFESRNYKVKWYLIKNAINDGLIKHCQIAEALTKVEVSEKDTLDFIKFVFNKINDINLLCNIFFQRKILHKEFMLYGYSNGFLNFDDLLILAKASDEFATALVFILKNEQLNKSITNDKLQNIAFKLGNEVSHVRYECGLICHQSGNLEKASLLFSKVKGICSDNLSSKVRPKFQSSQTIPLTFAISHKTFIKAYQDYLKTRGLFSSQSAATQKVITKASRTYISDQRRFHILKKYAEKKSNFGRTFWSSVVCHFSPLFIEYDNNNCASNCTSVNKI